jgi:NDP-sugar pyrophosphorylase family protein
MSRSIPSHALVMTAGLGTRLQPLTGVRAKSAIPVAGEPMVRRIAAWLVSNGVDDIVLNLHHLPHTIAAVMGDGSDMAARVRYSWEQPRVLGAAGGPRQALTIVGADTFLIVNGDVLTDVDLQALSDAHGASGAMATLALVPSPEPHRYGSVSLDGSHRVIGFVPPGASVQPSYHFVGVQIVHADVFRALPPGRPAESIRGVYDELIAARLGAIRGFVSNAAFWDVGTVSDYWSTSWSISDAAGLPEVTCGRGTRIDETARVSRSILWDDVDVSGDCVLDECVVTDRVSVPRGARLRRTILVRAADGTQRAFPF